MTTSELQQKIADRLRLIHFDGQGCGTEPDNVNACSNCFGPSPMSADEVAEEVMRIIVGTR